MFPSSKNIDGSNIDLTNYYTKTEIDTLINSQGQAYIPCGSVQAFMTTTAPQGYLVCDGTEYLKSAYPQLAAVLAAVDTAQSTTNFAGSDANHFKVPDLRGEFLRGTGTNGHTNQGNGASVGTHQDGTEHKTMYLSSSSSQIQMKDSTDWAGNINKSDKTTTKASLNTTLVNGSKGSTITETNQLAFSTSRPTNTSVLYCIAYQDIYLAPRHQYSTEEKVVGTWIDGKPLYEIVYQGLTPSSYEKGRVWTRYQMLPDDADVCFIVGGFYKDINNANGFGTNLTVQLPFSGISNQLNVQSISSSNKYYAIGSTWRIIQRVNDTLKRQLAFVYCGGDENNDLRGGLTEYAFSQQGAKPLQYNVIVQYTKTTD